jgi:hypothetical protein
LQGIKVISLMMQRDVKLHKRFLYSGRQGVLGLALPSPMLNSQYVDAILKDIHGLVDP